MDQLMEVDVVLFGDVDPRQFTTAQLKMLNDFVSEKGGGFGMIAAKLRHIAIAAEDPEAMAEFYKKAFDFKEVGRPNGYLADGVFLSDGTLNMAILKFKTDQLGKGMDYRGLHHFGVLVEDVEEFEKKLQTLGAQHYIDQGQQGHQAGYFEKKFYGPEGVLFDIAEHGWAGAEPLPAPLKDAAE